MLLDLTPLKISRDYRLLFFGQLISFFGSMMTFIVVPWQMFQLTKSSQMVGFLYLAEFVRWFASPSSAARSPTLSTVAGCCG
jgi:hypothetical protein